MTATIFGATGMVGTEVLGLCLSEDAFDQVVAIGRRKTGRDHPKLREVTLDNFLDGFLDGGPVEDELRATDVCFWCVGVYQGQVPADAFRTITCDYLDALVRAFERLRPDVTFCLFSAQGADPKERSPFLFAKAKGRAENILFESSLATKFALRPGFINPPPDTEKESRTYFGAKTAYKLFPALGIDTADLANVMVRVGLDGSAKAVLENRDLRSLAATMPEPK